MTNPLTGTPRTDDLMLATCTALYQQEVAAEEDLHRTLPFFTTALGIVIGALGFASAQMPPLPATGDRFGMTLFCLSALPLGLAMLDASLVLFWLLKAVARREHQRIGPEDRLRATLAQRHAARQADGTPPGQMDARLLDDMRHVLLDAYCAVTPGNRVINRDRHRFRAQASTHLVRSLMWALSATIVIFILGKV